MRVKLNTTMAGPTGTATAGETVDLPAADAKALVAGGYAVAIDAEATTRRTATARPDAAAKAEAERLAAEEKAKADAAVKAEADKVAAEEKAKADAAAKAEAERLAATEKSKTA